MLQWAKLQGSRRFREEHLVEKWGGVGENIKLEVTTYICMFVEETPEPTTDLYSESVKELVAGLIQDILLDLTRLLVYPALAHDVRPLDQRLLLVLHQKKEDYVRNHFLHVVLAQAVGVKVDVDGASLAHLISLKQIIFI